jgi:hypothetical protein
MSFSWKAGKCASGAPFGPDAGFAATAKRRAASCQRKATKPMPGVGKAAKSATSPCMPSDRKISLPFEAFGKE